LGFLYVDTGALYRALALKLQSCGAAPDDLEAVRRCLADTRLDLSGSPEHAHVWLDQRDVSGEIRTPAVSELASRLAALPGGRRDRDGAGAGRGAGPSALPRGRAEPVSPPGRRAGPR